MTTAMTGHELARWLTKRGHEVSPPLVATRVGAGQSNLTYLLRDDDGREWVLRKPPGASRAHNVHREARILAGLSGSCVPVPLLTGLGSDEAGIEGPFLIMQRCPGMALASEDDAHALSVAERSAIGIDAVRILADLHALAPEEVGLGDLGPRQGYLDRQIRRISENWQAWGGTSSSADRMWRDCQRKFAGGMPRSQRTGIAHGDYRLSNLLVQGGRVTAVLDWELCTLGDPLADLAWLADDWRSPDEPATIMDSPTRAGGFADREQMVQDYAARTGLDVSELDSYRALTHWKAATLLQGVVMRRQSGALGDHSSLDFRELQRSIYRLLDEAVVLA